MLKTFINFHALFELREKIVVASHWKICSLLVLKWT